jgi:hypothetical protein
VKTGHKHRKHAGIEGSIDTASCPRRPPLSPARDGVGPRHPRSAWAPARAVLAADEGRVAAQSRRQCVLDVASMEHAGLQALPMVHEVIQARMEHDGLHGPSGNEGGWQLGRAGRREGEHGRRGSDARERTYAAPRAVAARDRPLAAEEGVRATRASSCAAGGASMEAEAQLTAWVSMGAFQRIRRPFPACFAQRRARFDSGRARAPRVDAPAGGPHDAGSGSSVGGAHVP